MPNTKTFRWTRPKIDFVDPRTLPFIELQSRGELPHLYKEGGSYFVTFRLWDAVEQKGNEAVPAAESSCGAGVSPAGLESAGETPAPQRQARASHVPQTGKATIQQWRAIQREFDDEKVWSDLALARRLAEATEPRLTSGSCLLRQVAVATKVENALLYFHDERYRLAAWCVMPNHVHVAYTALGQHTPKDIHHSWKSFLSHEINRMCSRSGTLWERESFDHLIRSIEHYEAYIKYIEHNPVEGGLCARPQDWGFSSAKYTET